MDMNRWLFSTVVVVLFFTAVCGDLVQAQRTGRGYWNRTFEIEPNGDTLEVIHILPVYVFDRKVDLRRYRRLVEAVKKVYPIAQIARQKMANMEADLARLPDKKSQTEYTKRIAREIEAEYTPVLRRMTATQGRVLLKLIDRETEYTAYEILKEFRGGFVAGFWQGISRIFGQNLKSEFDITREQEDKIIEQIVIYYEAGLL